ncbi:MAG: ribonuclease P protein component [Proteobacteria bacterium]|nr:ribonuclease P protein component [Pseudomonadota bacterium]
MDERSSRPRASALPRNPKKTPALRLERLKIRADFLRAARGIRRSAPGLTLELCPTPDGVAKPEVLRIGFTASRKVGNAVERNRAKRRLRAAAQALLPLLGLGGNDYVLVARRDTISRPFQSLTDDLAQVLKGAHDKLRSNERKEKQGG